MKKKKEACCSPSPSLYLKPLGDYPTDYRYTMQELSFSFSRRGGFTQSKAGQDFIFARPLSQRWLVSVLDS